MSLKTTIDEEIMDQFDGLHKMPLGTEEYKITVEGITKLMDKSNELKKIEFEQRDREVNREIETKLKHEQMKSEKCDRIVGHIITVISLGLQVGLAVWGTKATFQFEKDGHIPTVHLGKGFFNMLLPKKW